MSVVLLFCGSCCNWWLGWYNKNSKKEVFCFDSERFKRLIWKACVCKTWYSALKAATSLQMRRAWRLKVNLEKCSKVLLKSADFIKMIDKPVFTYPTNPWRDLTNSNKVLQNLWPEPWPAILCFKNVGWQIAKKKRVFAKCHKTLKDIHLLLWGNK